MLPKGTGTANKKYKTYRDLPPRFDPSLRENGCGTEKMANFTPVYTRISFYLKEDMIMENLGHEELKGLIEKVWEDHTLLRNLETQAAVNEVVELLDKGELRTAEPDGEGGWKVNDWVKKAVILYFPTRELRQTNAGEMEYNDKMDLKRNYRELGVRVVPPGCGALRLLSGTGRSDDALLRQYRRLRGRRHDDRYLGHGRLLRPDRQRGAPQRRSRHRRSARTGTGRSRHRRRPLLHRFALHHRGGGPHRTGGGHWSRYRDNGIHQDNRRIAAGTRHLQRLRSAAVGGHTRQLSQKVRRRGSTAYRAPSSSDSARRARIRKHRSTTPCAISTYRYSPAPPVRR